MFTQFYKDIDTLHSLIRPEWRYAYTLRSWNDAWMDVKTSIGTLVVEALKGTL